MGRLLLEREREVAELAAAARDAAAGAGSVVLVCGEAGIGKSAVVEALRSALPANGRLLIGYCDDLATRRALGPIRDLAGSVGTELTRALEAGADRNRLLDALRAELSWAGHPTVLVIEDVHWADEATLDVLGYLVRRIATLPAERLGPLRATGRGLLEDRRTISSRSPRKERSTTGTSKRRRFSRTST